MKNPPEKVFLTLLMQVWAKPGNAFPSGKTLCMLMTVRDLLKA